MSEKLSQHSVETPIEQTKQAVQEETKGMLDSLKDMFKKPWESVKDALKDVLSVFGGDTALGKLFRDIFGIEVKENTTEDEYFTKVKEVLGKRVQDLQAEDVDGLFRNKSLLPFLNPTFRREMAFLPNTTYTTYIKTILENAPKDFVEQFVRMPLGDIFPANVTHLTVGGTRYDRSGNTYVSKSGTKLEIESVDTFIVNEEKENTILEIKEQTSMEGLDTTPLYGKVTREKLEKNAPWQQQLRAMLGKYPGLSQAEIYRVIKGESAFNTKAINEGTKAKNGRTKAKNGGTRAAGLFQFMPGTAKELGYTTQQILQMDAAAQLQVYDKYLQRWGYRGGGLGIMQAAPAYANKPKDFVIYPVGSPAWQQNPGWRKNGNGPVTPASVNEYYARQVV